MSVATSPVRWTTSSRHPDRRAKSTLPKTSGTLLARHVVEAATPVSCASGIRWGDAEDQLLILLKQVDHSGHHVLPPLRSTGTPPSAQTSAREDLEQRLLSCPPTATSRAQAVKMKSGKSQVLVCG